MNNLELLLNIANSENPWSNKQDLEKKSINLMKQLDNKYQNEYPKLWETNISLNKYLEKNIHFIEHYEVMAISELLDKFNTL